MKNIQTLQDELIQAKLYEINSFETAEECEGFYLTPISQKESGLPMIVNLRCLENFNGEPPFLRFQNDRNPKYNTNWIKMYIDGTFDNYENKVIIFSEEEMQSLKDWIKLNENIIKKHYYQECSSCEVCKNIVKIKK